MSVVDPKGLEAARKAVGTIPGAWLWSDIEKAISAYLVATEPVGPKLWGRYPGTGVWHQIADGSNTDEQVAGFEATYARAGWTELRRDNPFAATSPAGDLVEANSGFDDWFHEREGFALRSERFDGDVAWLKAAFEAGRSTAQALRHQPTGVTEEIRTLAENAGAAMDAGMMHTARSALCPHRRPVCSGAGMMGKMEDAPNPGSHEALAQGCKCAVIDNGHGRGWRGMEGVFVYTVGCPVHPIEDELAKAEEIVPGILIGTDAAREALSKAKEGKE